MHGWKPPIIHRDLKTMNILVTLTYQLKICDFGTARFKRESTSRIAGYVWLFWLVGWLV
jgi:serine/threonine protein kinase